MIIDGTTFVGSAAFHGSWPAAKRVLEAEAVEWFELEDKDSRKAPDLRGVSGGHRLQDAGPGGATITIGGDPLVPKATKPQPSKNRLAQAPGVAHSAITRPKKSKKSKNKMKQLQDQLSAAARDERAPALSQSPLFTEVDTAGFSKDRLAMIQAAQFEPQNEDVSSASTQGRKFVPAGTHANQVEVINNRFDSSGSVLEQQHTQAGAATRFRGSTIVRQSIEPAQDEIHASQRSASLVIPPGSNNQAAEEASQNFLIKQESNASKDHIPPVIKKELVKPIRDIQAFTPQMADERVSGPVVDSSAIDELIDEAANLADQAASQSTNEAHLESLQVSAPSLRAQTPVTFTGVPFLIERRLASARDVSSSSPDQSRLEHMKRGLAILGYGSSSRASNLDFAQLIDSEGQAGRLQPESPLRATDPPRSSPPTRIHSDSWRPHERRLAPQALGDFWPPTDVDSYRPNRDRTHASRHTLESAARIHDPEMLRENQPPPLAIHSSPLKNLEEGEVNDSSKAAE